jgi:hypothetical protein
MSGNQKADYATSPADNTEGDVTADTLPGREQESMPRQRAAA